MTAKVIGLAAVMEPEASPTMEVVARPAFRPTKVLMVNAPVLLRTKAPVPVFCTARFVTAVSRSTAPSAITPRFVTVRTVAATCVMLSVELRKMLPAPPMVMLLLSVMPSAARVRTVPEESVTLATDRVLASVTETSLPPNKVTRPWKSLA